jgi:hypothetical protein
MCKLTENFLESRGRKREELIFRAFGRNFYKHLSKKGLYNFNNPHFLVFWVCFHALSNKNAQKYALFEQKLTNISDSQRFICFLADLSLSGTKRPFTTYSKRYFSNSKTPHFYNDEKGVLTFCNGRKAVSDIIYI